MNASGTPGRLRILTTVVTLCTILLGIVLPIGALEASDDGEMVLSVLDFADNSDSPDWAWLESGLADMLITDLAAAGLILVNRDDLEAALEEQSLALTGLADDRALELGRMLSADTLLTGSYFLTGGELRIDARIIDVTGGDVRGSASVRGAPESIFTLEATLVSAICREFGIEAPTKTVAAGTSSIPAARSYYEGLVLQASGDIEAARSRFEAAARLDPLYPAPRYSLEESWRLLEDFRALRKQREMNALWRKAEALKKRLAASPFVSDADIIIAAYAAGTPTEKTAPAPTENPSFGACSDPAVCLWNLQLTYWEISSMSSGVFDDRNTEEAALKEIIRLGTAAEEAWPEDPWLPEILYWSVFARRWLGDWQEVKTGCERFFLEWPDFRMAWALEDMYEVALTELSN